MDRPMEASRCRQRIAEGLVRLTHLAQVAQGRESMIRASLFQYRRRCGTRGCRCERGEWHQGRALSVSKGGRSRILSLAGLDDAELQRDVEAYRQWRKARAKMVRTFAEMLEAVDRLGRVRTVPIERVRRLRVRPE